MYLWIALLHSLVTFCCIEQTQKKKDKMSKNEGRRETDTDKWTEIETELQGVKI